MAVVVTGLGWFFQAREARRLHALSDESQARLRQSYLIQGNTAAENSDYLTSLVWLTEALKITLSGTSQADSQRRRWEANWRQCPRLVGFGTHSGPIHTAEVRPDGRRLLTASSDHTARLQDLETGQTVLVLKHGREVLCATFSRDGKRIATAGEDYLVKVWDSESGELCFPPLPHENTVSVRPVHGPHGPEGSDLRFVYFFLDFFGERVFNSRHPSEPSDRQ
jgi:WD40 repeat protein